MLLNRREFLRLAAAASAAGLIIPAWMPPREPYVSKGAMVTYVGQWGTPEARAVSVCGFVAEVGEWDRIGYPVKTQVHTGRFGTPPEFMDVYDFNLAESLTAWPRNLWHFPENCAKYPNVHCYVRMHRFGETAAQALRVTSANLHGWEGWLNGTV